MGLAAFFKGCLNLQTLIVDHDATGQDGWNQALSMIKNGDSHWALYAKSVLDQTRLALTSKAEWYQHLLQPSAEYLGSRLGVDQWAVINYVEAIGYVVVMDKLFTVQNKSFGQPTILVAKSMKGEEDILGGAVVVLTSDMPNVLSHVSVRARNSKVCFATCFDPNILADLQANERKLLQIKPISADIVYSKVEGGLTSASSANLNEEGPLLSIKLVRKQFGSRYAISLEFTSEAVGAK